MARIKFALSLTFVAALLVQPSVPLRAQDPITPFANPVTNRPILNGFRQRATDNLLLDMYKKFSLNSPLSGKLCPSCADRRNARFEEAANDRELLKRAKLASVDKLEQEAKKLKFEAKALEEADFEKHKPWDVAAPENLESPSPLLQAAAASKQDQDLAPKKIRALEYLAQLGCSKDPNVEAAIVEGLKDHNPAVRWAAIQAVIASARGVTVDYSNHPFVNDIVPQQPENSMIDPLKYRLEEEGYPAKEIPMEEKKDDEANGEGAVPAPACGKCGNCRKRKPCLQRLKGLCKSCKGHGCRRCNFGGHNPQTCCADCSQPIQEVPCEPCMACQTHDGCKTCCPSKKIIDELKRIAFDPDPDRTGCYYEPQLDLRNLALEALNVCPPLPEKQQGGGGGGVPETSVNPNVPGVGEGTPEPDTDSPTLDDQTRNRVNSFVPISYRNTPVNNQSNLLMNGRVTKFYPNGFLIEFQGDYQIPTGKQLLIETGDGKHTIVNVVKSAVGFAQVTTLDGQVFSSPTSQISVGVIQD